MNEYMYLMKIIKEILINVNSEAKFSTLSIFAITINRILILTRLSIKRDYRVHSKIKKENDIITEKSLKVKSLIEPVCHKSKRNWSFG
jgi:hypothetical protein